MMIQEGKVSFQGYQTYYRIVNPEGKNIPLLLLHGGPGSTHNSFEVLDSLAYESDRPLIMYDQLGCGESSLCASHPDLWTMDTWIDELINLREKLKLEKVHLLGHSFGGMLLLSYLVERKPKGIASIILSSTLSSSSLWREETHRLVNLLPDFERQTIVTCEAMESYSSLEFQLAVKHYSEKFVFSDPGKEGPECLHRKKVFGKESYETAWGPCEFSPTGTLKDYDVTSFLSNITCPTLLLSGVNDESTPLQNKVMYDALTCEKKWVLFQKSRHMSYYEENEKYQKTVADFLTQVNTNMNEKEFYARLLEHTSYQKKKKEKLSLSFLVETFLKIDLGESVLSELSYFERRKEYLSFFKNYDPKSIVKSGSYKRQLDSLLEQIKPTSVSPYKKLMKSTLSIARYLSLFKTVEDFQKEVYLSCETPEKTFEFLESFRLKSKIPSCYFNKASRFFSEVGLLDIPLLTKHIKDILQRTFDLEDNNHLLFMKMLKIARVNEISLDELNRRMEQYSC